MLLSGLIAAVLGASRAFAALDPILDAEDRGLLKSPAITAGLADSRNVTARIMATTALGRIQLPGAIDPLIAMLGDHNSAVVSAAAFALGQLSWDPAFNGGRTDDITKALAGVLTGRALDPTTGTRVAPDALIALSRFEGTPAFGAIWPFLTSKADTVRNAALRAIYHSATSSSNTGPVSAAVTDAQIAVLQGLVNDTLTVRRSLAFAVRVISDDRLTSLAQTLLKDSDEFVRYPVVSTRYTGKNPALLQSLLADPSQHVRVAALTVTIARQPAILAGNVLTTVAADKSFHVRSVLAAGLPATAPADLWGRLIADASPTVRSSALMGYQAAFGNDSVGVLTTAIKSDPSPYVRGAAATAAGKLPSSLADPIFQIGAADSSPIVVYSVFEAFAGAPYANDWILSSISAYLSAPTIYLRSSAVDALTALPTPQPVSYIQQAYLNSFEPNPRKFKDIRQQLVDLIAASPDADASTAALTADLSDPYTQVTNDARAALTSRNVTSLPSSPETPLELSPYRENVVAAAGTSTARVALHTTKGDMVIELYADDAPIHVASFLGVVRSGVYDGLTWHRVVDNFVIQGLDPDGNGYGDDGFTLRAEINGRLFTRGAVGMPRSASFASGGCQVFIAHVPIPHLDGQYTVFGQVVSGLDVIDLIEVGDLVLSAKVVA